MKIDISDKLYNRLAQHVVGFEQPENVIERILNDYEGRKVLNKPEIIFVPNEDTFKDDLLIKKEAWKHFEFVDGSTSDERWVANRFSEDSNLRANLWSGSLRDWQVKGIKSLTLSIEKLSTPISEISSDEIEIQVGKFIQDHLPVIAEYCENHPEHISELCDLGWSKLHLGLSSFPFMKLSSEITPKENAGGRFWKRHRFMINGKEYRFCSQFGGNSMVGTQTLSEFHGKKFLQYLKSKDLLLPNLKEKRFLFLIKG